MESIREEVFKPHLSLRHRKNIQDFTRHRKLSFTELLLFQLQKGVKSLQLRLNEFTLGYEQVPPITKSAYSQARQKLSHSVFIELDKKLTTEYYKLGGIKTWNNYRLLSVDGSRIALPSSEELIERFGGQYLPATHHHEASVLPQGYLSLCYDVLNELCLNGVIDKNQSYELTLAKSHQTVFQKNDVVLYDRHYASYEFIAWLSQQPGHFIIRCPRSTFREGMRVFKGGAWSRIVTLETPGRIIKSLEDQGLPRSVMVRFIRVILPNGETEVLVTSLLDLQIKQEDFQRVYGLRWNIETFFSRIKVRLNLENFTGKSVEAVLQDLYSTLFVANLETVVTEDTTNELSQKKGNQYVQKINKSVSYNLIKNQMFDLLFNPDICIEEVLGQMLAILTQSPVQIRPGRQVERDKSGPYRKLRYHKSSKKICF